MGKLYETGGQADILLSFKTQVTIAGRTYAANEPYMYLSDVNYDFRFKETDSAAETRANLIKFHQIVPSAVALTDLPLSSKICDLILERQKENSISCMKRWKAKGNGSTLILPDEPADGKVYIYENGEVVEFDSIDGNIIHGNFDFEKDYVIFYSGKVEGDVYGLEHASLPYMSMQIMIKGNTNKTSSRTVLILPTVVLNSTPIFGTSYNDIMKVPLVFEVISSRLETPVVLFE